MLHYPRRRHRWPGATQHDLFRQVNDQIVRMVGAYNARDPEFVCECADGHCVETVQMPIAKYRAVRWNPRHYVLACGHDDPEFEQVVEETRAWVIVELLRVADPVADRE